jgi:multidrug efflux pump subunit AcrA (membrane-fusion protein)
MTVQTVINVESADNVLTIPVTAVKEDGARQYVDILTPQKTVERHDVVTGVSDGLNIEVQSGLSEHDKVIIAGLSSDEIADKASSVHGPRGF